MDELPINEYYEEYLEEYDDGSIDPADAENDGTGAELFRGNQRVGVLWPLLCEEGDGAEL